MTQKITHQLWCNLSSSSPSPASTSPFHLCSCGFICCLLLFLQQLQLLLELSHACEPLPVLRHLNLRPYEHHNGHRHTCCSTVIVSQTRLLIQTITASDNRLWTDEHDWRIRRSLRFTNTCIGHPSPLPPTSYHATHMRRCARKVDA